MTANQPIHLPGHARRLRPGPLVTGLLAALLMATPGIAQCAVLVDLAPGTAGGFPQGFVHAFERDLYFTWPHPTFGAELWRWNAASGVTLVRDVNPGTAHSTPAEPTPCCTPLGPRVFFAASVPGVGRELWMTDGTPAGTVMVKDIDPVGSSSSNPHAIFAADGRVFFEADDGINGAELWTSDGTTAGTVMVADINPGPANSLPGGFVSANGKTFFTAAAAATGRELYVTDGTAAGTRLLLDIAPGTGSGAPPELVPCGDVVFFAAATTTFGNELWKSDGTTAGTVMVKDLASNSSSSSPINFCVCGGTLFFNAVVNTTGRELYRSDGTAAGTVPVKDINPGAASSGVNNLTCAGDRIFCSASNGLDGVELWVSDGTAAGTVQVLDILPGPTSSFPQLMVACGAGVSFRATDSMGPEVWFSDGTAAGTFRVCDIQPGAAGSNPTQFTVGNGRVFFTALDPAAGQELFHIATPGATTAKLGSGGFPDRPTLAVRAGARPVLGRAIDLVATGPAVHVGVLFLAPARYPSPPIPGLMQGGCDWIGVLSGGATVLVAGPPPGFSLPITVPNQPALEGAALNCQVVWVNLAAPPPLLQFSNGLQLVLGTAAPH